MRNVADRSLEGGLLVEKTKQVEGCGMPTTPETHHKKQEVASTSRHCRSASLPFCGCARACVCVENTP